MERDGRRTKKDGSDTCPALPSPAGFRRFVISRPTKAENKIGHRMNLLSGGRIIRNPTSTEGRLPACRGTAKSTTPNGRHRNSAWLNAMNPSIQIWDSLPDHIKSQAAVEMLSGAAWSYFGKTVERPRDSELTRWIPPPVCPARRTNADKRRDVLAALKVMPRASLRAVARQTGTSHQLVANVRSASKRTRRGTTKEESSTSDGGVSLPVVSNCDQSWHFHSADELQRAAMCGSDGQ